MSAEGRIYSKAEIVIMHIFHGGKNEKHFFGLEAIKTPFLRAKMVICSHILAHQQELIN